MDDALSDRSWVDSEHCKSFVDNILASFGTVLPTKQSEQVKKEIHTTGSGKSNRVFSYSCKS